MTLTWGELLNYYHRIPDDEIAFYSTADAIEDIAPTICAMLNSYGGYIFIGVDFGNFHLLGCDLDKQQVDLFVSGHFKNVPEVDFDVVLRNDRRICMITIPEADLKPQLYKGQCYIRENGETRRATIEEEATMRDQTTAQQQFLSQKPFQPLRDKEPFLVQDISQETTVESDSSVEGPLEATPVMEKPVAEPEKNENETPSLMTGSAESSQQETVISQENHSEISPKLSEAATEVEAKTETEIKETIVLNKRQKKTLRFLKRHKSIRNKKYRALFGVSHKTAHIELTELKEAGFIAVDGQGRSTKYLPLDLSPVATKRHAKVEETPVRDAYQENIDTVVSEIADATDSSALETASSDYQSEVVIQDITKSSTNATNESEEDILDDSFEHSLIEIKNLIGEVENSAHSEFDAPSFQDSDMVRKNFLIAFLKHNSKISCDHYSQLLRISQEQAMSDLISLEENGELSKLVHSGAIYYELCQKEAERLESMAQLLAS